jgi:hypothetical protein
MEEQPSRDQAGNPPPNRRRGAKAAFTPPETDRSPQAPTPRSRPRKAPAVLFQPPAEQADTPPADLSAPSPVDPPITSAEPAESAPRQRRSRRVADGTVTEPNEPTTAEPIPALEEKAADGPPAKATPRKRTAAKKAAAPKTTPTKAAAPKTRAVTPEATPTNAVTPKTTPSKAATPKTATPKTATPKAITTKAATPKTITTKAATPKTTTTKAATSTAPGAAVGKPATDASRPASPGPVSTPGPVPNASPVLNPGPVATPDPVPHPVPAKALADVLPQLLDHPEQLPELLAVSAVDVLGPGAADWASRLRESYPAASADGLARLATRRYVRLAGAGGAASAAAGLFAPLAGLATLIWTRAGLVLHLAAAYGLDPADPKRAVDLLVLTEIHPDDDSARRALSVARRESADGAPALRELAGAGSRLGVPLALQAGGWLALRFTSRLIPGVALLAAGAAGAAGAERLAARAVTRFRTR